MNENGISCEIVQKIFKYLYKIRELVPSEIFEHDEMLEHFKNILNKVEGVKKISKRRYRVNAEKKSHLLYIQC